MPSLLAAECHHTALTFSNLMLTIHNACKSNSLAYAEAIAMCPSPRASRWWRCTCLRLRLAVHTVRRLCSDRQQQRLVVRACHSLSRICPQLKRYHGNADNSRTWDMAEYAEVCSKWPLISHPKYQNTQNAVDEPLRFFFQVVCWSRICHNCAYMYIRLQSL